jgi:hypothetical protein
MPVNCANFLPIFLGLGQNVIYNYSKYVPRETLNSSILGIYGIFFYLWLQS